jgi:hypothetical protein
MTLRDDPPLSAGEINGFSDEQGHRRPVDAPLLAWRFGVPLQGVATSPATHALGDERLWWALHDASIDVDGLLAPENGPLLRFHDRRPGIEVWTEAELAGLHALWHLARVRGRQDWHARALLAAAWHVEHLQPDNATNHAWAIHVFVENAISSNSPDNASLHAETLLHNCMVAGGGRPDRFSAHLLLDSATALRAIG